MWDYNPQPFEVFEIAVCVATTGETWQGIGHWPAPADDREREELADLVAGTVTRSIRQLLGTWPLVRSEQQCRTFTVRGPAARVFRQRVLALAADDPARILWEPLFTAHYTLTGEVYYG